MTNTFNAIYISLFISKKLWIHPIEKSVYFFTGGNYTSIADKTDYLLANVFHNNDNEIIFYKVYDKVITDKVIPFITIGILDYEVVFLAVGTNDDKLVLKASENEELVFVSHSFDK